MKLYVDACPKVMTIFVANTRLDLPVSTYITMKKVSAGFDVADNAIVGWMQEGDLVITADIPLAYEVVKKGGFALNPRGQLYTSEIITQAMATRDLMTNLRDAGLVSSGASPFSKTDRQTFANHLDRIITQNV